MSVLTSNNTSDTKLSLSTNDTTSIGFVKSSISAVTYRICFEKDEKGWLVVTSPDIPSLITQAKTEDEAIRNTIEVIRLLIEESHIEDKDFNLLITNSN